MIGWSAKRGLLVGLPILLALVAAGIYAAGFGRGETWVAVPRTEAFPNTLSSLGIYQSENMAALDPTDGYHLVELQSGLFSDGSKKQRLLHVPGGTVVTHSDDGMPTFPEGTTLVKTFSFNEDDRDPTLGRRIIETRLLTLTDGQWNVATYVWNDQQTEATLLLDGATQAIDWIDSLGRTRSINYEIPDERMCVSCHQSAGQVTPLGPELRNLNLTVTRDGGETNQLAHLQTVGVLDEVDPGSVETIVDYLDPSVPISERGRAYLDMNCSHCHQPQAWSRSAGQGYDFRWEIPNGDGGVAGDEEEIFDEFQSGRMPFLGTTIIDEDGLAILTEYLDSVESP